MIRANCPELYLRAALARINSVGDQRDARSMQEREDCKRFGVWRQPVAVQVADNIYCHDFTAEERRQWVLGVRS